MRLFNIHVSQYLTGCKNAIRNGDDLTVSPAMYELMKHANEDELQQLLEKIGVIDMSNEKATLLVTPKKRDPLDDIMLRMRYEV